MSTAVREILERIQGLPESEQLELRSELARQEEKEWAQLLVQARKTARERNIDDAAINKAVESIRYGDDASKQ